MLQVDVLLGASRMPPSQLSLQMDFGVVMGSVSQIISHFQSWLLIFWWTSHKQEVTCSAVCFGVQGLELSRHLCVSIFRASLGTDTGRPGHTPYGWEKSGCDKRQGPHTLPGAIEATL